MGYVESVKSTIAMMIFSFFFMLFYTVTHAILSMVAFLFRGIFKVVGFMFGAGH